MIELAKLGHTREMRMTLVSRELGHFRPEIVSEYVRENRVSVATHPGYRKMEGSTPSVLFFSIIS